MINTPVLIIAFNRPEMLQKVVNALSVHKLSRLYAFVDGPREENLDDIKKVEDCKKIFGTIDFCEEVIEIYSDKNLGCGGGPFHAITTAFEKETKLIILEDDCVSGAAFPAFCEELLLRYENQEKIWMISGNNFSESYKQGTNSYVFSQYAHFWGWATWRRSWENIVLPVDFYRPKLETIIQKKFPDKSEKKFFMKEFGYNLNHPAYDGWDYQAALTIWEHDGLCIIPQKNLVSNIGSHGTHFSGEKPFFNLPVDNDFKISVHPSKIEREAGYDSFHFRNHWKKVNKRPFLKRVIGYIRKRYHRLTDNGLF